MTLVQSIVFYSIKFILIGVVAVCGIIVGKKLRDRKDAKKSALDADKE